MTCAAGTRPRKPGQPETALTTTRTRRFTVMASITLPLPASRHSVGRCACVAYPFGLARRHVLGLQPRSRAAGATGTGLAACDFGEQVAGRVYSGSRPGSKL